MKTFVKKAYCVMYKNPHFPYDESVRRRPQSIFSTFAEMKEFLFIYFAEYGKESVLEAITEEQVLNAGEAGIDIVITDTPKEGAIGFTYPTSVSIFTKDQIWTKKEA